MPPTESFRLCQIIHYLQSLCRDQGDITTITFYKNKCLRGPGTWGSISELYVLLTDQGSKLPYQLSWEADLGETIDENIWSKWSTMVHKGILNTSLVEANYKVFSRWYLVTTRITKIYPDASPHCFRGCGPEGTMLHTWWTCPKIKRFWIRIFNLVYSMTGVHT